MLRRIAGWFVRLMQRWMPDPFLFAVLLTFVTYLASLALTDCGPFELLGHWYTGLWTILPFAMQMIMVLVAGYALADAPLLRAGLDRLSRIPRTQAQAAVTVLLGAAVGSLLNWGFGLVAGAILAKRIAGRLPRADFAFLVAAAYSGFILWESGLSSTIALISATPAHAMNHVERVTGAVLPLSDTILAPINVVPVLATLVLLPVLFVLMQPGPEEARPFAASEADEAVTQPEAPATPAGRLEGSVVVTALLSALVFGGLAANLVVNEAAFDINSMILLLIGLGILLHRTPIRYVHAVNRAARTVGPLVLQYPLYGGIMGLLEHSGAAAVFSNWFVDISTPRTLPFWSYIGSNILNFFVPSGGGHWAVQGGIVVQAAGSIGASQPATCMGVAFGDQVANMVQPFWALPLLAVAGLGIRDVMGYCVISFLAGLVVFGASLLVFS